MHGPMTGSETVFSPDVMASAESKVDQRTPAARRGSLTFTDALQLRKSQDNIHATIEGSKLELSPARDAATTVNISSARRTHARSRSYSGIQPVIPASVAGQIRAQVQPISSSNSQATSPTNKPATRRTSLAAAMSMPVQLEADFESVSLESNSKKSLANDESLDFRGIDTSPTTPDETRPSLRESWPSGFKHIIESIKRSRAAAHATTDPKQSAGQVVPGREASLAQKDRVSSTPTSMRVSMASINEAGSPGRSEAPSSEISSVDVAKSKSAGELAEAEASQTDAHLPVAVSYSGLDNANGAGKSYNDQTSRGSEYLAASDNYITSSRSMSRATSHSGLTSEVTSLGHFDDFPSDILMEPQGSMDGILIGDSEGLSRPKPIAIQASDAIMMFPRRTRSDLSRMSVTELKDLLQSLLMAVDKANDVLIRALEERELVADVQGRRPSLLNP